MERKRLQWMVGCGIAIGLATVLGLMAAPSSGERMPEGLHLVFQGDVESLEIPAIWHSQELWQLDGEPYKDSQGHRVFPSHRVEQEILYVDPREFARVLGALPHCSPQAIELPDDDRLILHLEHGSGLLEVLDARFLSRDPGTRSYLSAREIRKPLGPEMNSETGESTVLIGKRWCASYLDPGTLFTRTPPQSVGPGFFEMFVHGGGRFYPSGDLIEGPFLGSATLHIAQSPSHDYYLWFSNT